MHAYTMCSQISLYMHAFLELSRMHARIQYTPYINYDTANFYTGGGDYVTVGLEITLTQYIHIHVHAHVALHIHTYTHTHVYMWLCLLYEKIGVPSRDWEGFP